MIAPSGAVEYARRLTKVSGTNFYYAFLFLPRPKREAIYGVYAFCRRSDDIVDLARVGAGPGEAAAELARWRQELAACYRGEATHPIMVRLADIVRQFRIPQAYFEELIAGVEMDLLVSRYPTFPDLRQYCRRVASMVGLICIEIFGYTNPGARVYAEQLGIAFQLTNILRDLGVDLKAGRIYLPQEDLDRFGVAEADLLRRARTEAFAALMRFQAERARSFYRAAAEALPPEDRRSLLAAEIMRGIYADLLRAIERGGFDVFGGPVSLPRYRKLSIAAGLWLRHKLLP